MNTRRRTDLIQLRRELGFTQESLAEQLHVSRNTVARWERGEGDFPRPATAARLAKTLNVSMADLRSSFGITSPSAEVPRTTAFDRPRGRHVDAAQLEALRQEIGRIDAAYDAAPSASLLSAASSCLVDIAGLHRVTPESNRRELLAIEAGAATLIGILAWDASQRREHQMAHQHFMHAAVTARRIGDRVAESYALLRISYLALYGTERSEEGLRAAQHAQHRAPRESAVLQGLTTLHVAEGHAMLGRRSECEKALSIAETSFAQVHGTDPAIRHYSATQLQRMAGSCYLFLGKPGRAVPILDAAVQASPAVFKSKAIMLGNLGLAHARQGRIDRAAASLNAGIDLLERSRGGGGIKVVTKAALELRPWRAEPVVAEVHDRLLTLAGT